MGYEQEDFEAIAWKVGPNSDKIWTENLNRMDGSD